MARGVERDQMAWQPSRYCSGKPRFSVESSGSISGEEVLANARSFELALALINRAKRLVHRTLQEEAHSRISDMVLLRLGKQSEVSKFEARM